MLEPEKRRQLELLLLERLKQHKTDLKEMLGVMSDHWNYEDHFYRYYHGSFKVYRAQDCRKSFVPAFLPANGVLEARFGLLPKRRRQKTRHRQFRRPHRGNYLEEQDFAKRHFFIMTALCLPAMPFDAPFNVTDQSLAELHFARVALAVERFRLAQGRLPENLNELVPQFLPKVLVDPFDGQPLRYHRLDKGYIV